MKRARRILLFFFFPALGDMHQSGRRDLVQRDLLAESGSKSFVFECRNVLFFICSIPNTFEIYTTNISDFYT